jgi:hypothetical protein
MRLASDLSDNICGDKTSYPLEFVAVFRAVQSGKVKDGGPGDGQ